MSSRLGLLEPSKLNAEQKHLYAGFEKLTKATLNDE